MAKKKIKMNLEAGDVVYVFNPKTKRCTKRVIIRPTSMFGLDTHVIVDAPRDERHSYSVYEIGRTKKEAESNYYLRSLEHLDYWKEMVDWYENKYRK